MFEIFVLSVTNGIKANKYSLARSNTGLVKSYDQTKGGCLGDNMSRKCKLTVAQLTTISELQHFKLLVLIFCTFIQCRLHNVRR
jgi:hypothetical protein